MFTIDCTWQFEECFYVKVMVISTPGWNFFLQEKKSRGDSEKSYIEKNQVYLKKLSIFGKNG